MEVVVARQTYLEICRDVAHDDGSAVGHGFEQCDGQSFVRRGEDVAAAMIEERMQTATFDEAREDDTILLGQFAKLDGIGILEVGVTGNDEFVAVGIDLREGLDELMQILLGCKTAHTQDVLAMLDAKVTEVARFVDVFGCCYAIVNEVHLARDAVLSVHHVAYALADDDDTVGKDAAHGFAQTEHQFGSPSPLDAIIVLSVMGEDHLHVEHTGERGEQRRTAGMDMYELFGGVNVAELSVDKKVDLYIELVKYLLQSMEYASNGHTLFDAITNYSEPIFDDYCVYADADKGTKTLMFTVHEDAEIQWKNRYTVLGEKKFEGDEVVVNAPEGAESGAWFVNGKRIDTLETVENYVVGENNALTITVCEPVESVEWKEFASNSMVMSSRKKVGNYIKVNLTAKWALLEGAEVVEAGIARVYAEDCPEDFDAQYIYDNGSKKVSSLKTLNGKYSYALSMNSKSAKKTLCAFPE